MKAWLLALVLINIAFFAWVHLVGNAPPPPPPPETGAVRRLELVRDRSEVARARCLSVGPYAEQAAAERALAGVRTAQRDAKLRHADADGAAGFRVVVTTPTLQLATSTAMRLRAAGVGDLEVVPPSAGASEATVALGVYADRDRAQRRIEELRRYAIAPVVVELPRGAGSWWLDVADRAPAPGLDAASLLKLLGTPAGVSTVACPVAAGAAPPAASPPAAPAAAPATPAGEARTRQA